MVYLMFVFDLSSSNLLLLMMMTTLSLLMTAAADDDDAETETATISRYQYDITCRCDIITIVY